MTSLRRTTVVASLALAAVHSPLRAQAEPVPDARPHRAAAASMVRELSNLIARQASTYARSDTFSWGIGHAPADSLVTLEVLEAGTTGWSAIALHRADPGVRCAVVVGSAAPLFNVHRGPERPYCVDDAGSLLPSSGTVPDSAWAFWWQDELLDTRPEQLFCPSLKIPRLPARNDSVYVEFVVGVDGLPEPGGITLESTGSFDASVAMLMRLSQCAFRPATYRGTPVRTIMRQRIGLAPGRPEAPLPAEGFPNEPSRPPRAMAAMRRALAAVAEAQVKRHAVAGAYASDVSELPAGSIGDPATHVVMLSWGASGWSAVAFHDSTGARCVIAVGDSVPTPALPAHGGVPRCTGFGGTALVDTLPASEWVPVDPPERRRCNTQLQFRDDPMRRVRVTLEFVVGIDGRPDPRTLRILEGSGLVDDAGAVQMLAGCSYRPGRERGTPIRVLVRQPVWFN